MSISTAELGAELREAGRKLAQPPDLVLSDQTTCEGIATMHKKGEVETLKEFAHEPA